MIYLYLKQCNHCGLKYFGRTEKKDPIKYLGSGKLWRAHIKKHGKHNVNTISLWEFNTQENCTNFALEYSKSYNIVESNEYANLCIEDGLHLGAQGLSEQSRKKLSNSLIGNNNCKDKVLGPMKDEHKLKISNALRGKPLSEETRRKMSQARLGKTHSEETKAKMKLRRHSEETKLKMSISSKNRRLAINYSLFF